MEEGADESSALASSAGHEVLSALFLLNKFYKINATSLTGKSQKIKDREVEKTYGKQHGHSTAHDSTLRLKPFLQTFNKLRK